MTKTTLTAQAPTAQDVLHSRSSQSVANVPPGDCESLTGWGIASLAALRKHVASISLMTRAERVAAYLRGELTHEQIQEWLGRAPREVPRINGEFAHIAATTPEACFRCPMCGDDEVSLTARGALQRHPDFRDPNWGKPGAYDTGEVPVCPGSGTPPQKPNRVAA